MKQTLDLEARKSNDFDGNSKKTAKNPAKI